MRRPGRRRRPGPVARRRARAATVKGRRPQRRRGQEAGFAGSRRYRRDAIPWVAPGPWLARRD
eukprot:11200895-Lingulodinium_polyedra.AAC.1